MTNDWNLEDTRQPPDEPEAEYCESCGQEMEILDDFGGQKYTKCVNQFCPENFTGEAKEMAEKLVETLDTVSRLENRVKFLSNRLKRVDPEWK